MGELLPMWPDTLTRSDLQLIRKAIRENWPAACSMKRRLFDSMFRELDTGGPRKVVAIARTALAADAKAIDDRQALQPQQ